jgi:hypothetical protein
MNDAAKKVDDALKAMVDGAHALICTIDKQTYDEWKRHEWDAPDDCEFLVTLTAKELLLLDKILDAYISAAGKGRSAIAPLTDPTKAQGETE